MTYARFIQLFLELLEIFYVLVAFAITAVTAIFAMNMASESYKTKKLSGKTNKYKKLFVLIIELYIVGFVIFGLNFSNIKIELFVTLCCILVSLYIIHKWLKCVKEKD